MMNPARIDVALKDKLNQKAFNSNFYGLEGTARDVEELCRGSCGVAGEARII